VEDPNAVHVDRRLKLHLRHCEKETTPSYENIGKRVKTARH